MERLRVSTTEREAILAQLAAQLKNCDNISKFKPDFTKMLEEKEILRPMLLMTSDIYLKMYSLVQHSSKEISWHGLVARDKEQQIYEIYDIVMFPQINTATTTTTDDDEYAEWLVEKMTDPKFAFNDMRMHGHSHVDMNVFSSGVDDAYQKELLTKVDDGDYYIFLVLNKKFEMCILLYDFEQNILFKNSDIDVRIIDKDGFNISNWSKTHIDKFVTELEQTRVTNYRHAGKKGKYYGSK